MSERRRTPAPHFDSTQTDPDIPGDKLRDYRDILKDLREWDNSPLDKIFDRLSPITNPQSLYRQLEKLWVRVCSYRKNTIEGWETDVLLEGQEEVVDETFDKANDKYVDTVKTYANWLDVHHLIYAYMIENTRIDEIFRAIVSELLHGEKLGNSHAQEWVRLTEALLFNNPPPQSLFNVVSQIRPSIQASRRNAYIRMFGMNLDHRIDEQSARHFTTPKVTNRSFVTVLQNLLKEIWVGIENRSSVDGPNPTDVEAIRILQKQLHDMLIDRQNNGNLRREEFFYVCTMAWLHKSIDPKTALMRDLKVEASSAGERLNMLGELVGVQAHPKSENFFILASPMSVFLKVIEENDPQEFDVTKYWMDDGLRQMMMQIITHWSLVTSCDLKAKTVNSQGAARPAPTRVA